MTRELPHPTAYRGPLLGAGAVVLTVGVALEQLRVSPGAGVQLLIAAALAAGLLHLGTQGPLPHGRPAAYQSALLVCGLLALAVALLRLAQVLGADLAGTRLPAGAFLWTGLVEAGAAAAVSARRNCAVAALIAAIALGIAVLSGWDWLFHPDGVAPYRWLLLVLATGFAVASLPPGDRRSRHAEQLLNAAGLAVLAIAGLQVLAGRILFVQPLPGLWELVLLAGGFGLVAYAAVARAPGPAYLGALVLAVFVAFQLVAAQATLRWWPLLLLLAGAAIMMAGLRSGAPAAREAGAEPEEGLPAAASADDVRVRVHRE